MPAPAVIPAPIVYFKVVAVKTLVVNLKKRIYVHRSVECIICCNISRSTSLIL